MFRNKKLKQLENQIEILHEEVFILDWKIKNPPKFKQGDLVKTQNGDKYQIHDFEIIRDSRNWPSIWREYTCISQSLVQNICVLEEDALTLVKEQKV